MGRFLVVGTGPLLDDPATRIVSGQCLRTMHFVRPLREAGHEVNLTTVPIPGCEDEDAAEAYRDRRYHDLLRYKAFTTSDETRIVRLLRRVLHREDFDAVVGINAYPAYLLARAEPAVPFWADLNGWTMAEGQVRAARVGHDRDYDHFWRLEVATLLAADRFSTVSTRQGDALYGELALVGRLNGLTFDWPFSDTVPNAIYPLYAEVQRLPEAWKDSPAAAAIPDGAHVVLWSGGFNSWTDVEMLAAGIGEALRTEPALYFLATGGAVHGHDEDTYARMRALAEQHWPEGRYAFLGWIETGEVVALHARADVAINIDSRNTETRFGARNRLTNMLGAGVPVVTTRGTEVAAWIEEHQAGEAISPGDAQALARALVDSHRRREEWERRAQKARTAAHAAFAPHATLASFLQWCDKPCFAPDRDWNAPPRRRERIRALNEDFEPRLWARLKLEGRVRALMNDSAALRSLRRKLPLRLWYRLKSIGRGK